LDDTTNELRTKLGSDHAASQLNLGFLVHPRSGGVGRPRGEGFDLRTNAWGSVRGMKGLLVTTDTASGPHVDAQGLTGQVGASLSLAGALSEVAEQHGADKLDAYESVKTLNEHAQATKKLGHGDRAKEVAAFKEPVLGLSSPIGIVSATPASQVLSAGENLHVGSGEDTNIGIGGKLAMAIKDAWSVFVQKSGIKLFAGKGNADIQAHDGSITIAADKDAKVISANGELSVTAKNTIKLNASGAQIELTANDVILTMPNNLKVKGNLIREAPGSVSTNLPTSPKYDESANYDQQFQVVDEETGKPLANINYKIEVGDGRIISGMTDQDGHTERVQTGDKPERLKLIIDDAPYDEQMILFDPDTGERLVDTAYRVELPDGSSIRGKTDDRGRTQRVKTGNSPEELKLYIEE
jgi:type VI secretion system secreted protein VgrG